MTRCIDKPSSSSTVSVSVSIFSSSLIWAKVKPQQLSKTINTSLMLMASPKILTGWDLFRQLLPNRFLQRLTIKVEHGWRKNPRSAYFVDVCPCSVAWRSQKFSFCIFGLKSISMVYNYIINVYFRHFSIDQCAGRPLGAPKWQNFQKISIW